MDETMQTDRRSFLKLSTAGGFALATMSTGAWVAGCAPAELAPGMRVLRPKDVVLLRAMTPAVLEGAIAGTDKVGIDATVQSFDRLMSDISPAVVRVVRQAFDALSFAPTRFLFAGRWSGWASASVEDVQASLAKLRDSPMELANAIYAALIRLTASAFYMASENDAFSGYPGPPQRVLSQTAVQPSHPQGAH